MCYSLAYRLTISRDTLIIIDKKLILLFIPIEFTFLISQLIFELIPG